MKRQRKGVEKEKEQRRRQRKKYMSVTESWIENDRGVKEEEED